MLKAYNTIIRLSAIHLEEFKKYLTGSARLAALQEVKRTLQGRDDENFDVCGRVCLYDFF